MRTTKTSLFFLCLRTRSPSLQHRLFLFYHLKDNPVIYRRIFTWFSWLRKYTLGCRGRKQLLWIFQQRLWVVDIAASRGLSTGKGCAVFSILCLDIDVWLVRPSQSVIRLATWFSSAGRGKTMIVFECQEKKSRSALLFFFLLFSRVNQAFKKKKGACSQCEFFLWVIIWTYIKLGQWFPPFLSHICGYWISARLFNIPHCLQVEELWQIRPV